MTDEDSEGSVEMESFEFARRRIFFDQMQEQAKNRLIYNLSFDCMTKNNASWRTSMGVVVGRDRDARALCEQRGLRRRSSYNKQVILEVQTGCHKICLCCAPFKVEMCRG